MAKIWLADFTAAVPTGWRGIWRRLCPRRLRVGETAAGDDVWLLEIPWAAAEFGKLPGQKQKRWLQKRLVRLAAGETLRLGLPLNLAEMLADVYPQELAAARSLAAKEFVRRLAKERGGLAGLAVGLPGLSEAWQGALVDELLAAGARPALQGVQAGAIAAAWWQRGVALPVISARRLLQTSDIVILLKPGLLPGAKANPRLAAFREPQVYVPGKFGGKYAFNMFPAGLAAILLDKDAAESL